MSGWLFLLAFVLSAGEAGAQPNGCSTPRDAANTLFYWQQPETRGLAKAAACLDPEAGGPAKLRTLARQTKTLYDSRGLYVDMERLSDDPEYTNSKTGLRRVVVHPGLKQIELARAPDGRWLWTAASLRTVAELYRETGMPLRSIVSRLPESFRERVLGLEIWQYLALGLLLILGLVLRGIVKLLVANRVKSLAKNLGQEWASNIADVIAAPLATLVMALGLRVSYPLLVLPVQMGVVIATLVRMLVVLSLVWALYKLVDVIAERMAKKAAATDTKLDDQLVPLVRKSLKIFVVIGGALFVLQNLQVDVGSLLTGLGIGGLAFALAAKETLANFFGSVMIFVDRPFQIGDWIVVKGTEGVVEEVGFRSTRVRTFYNSVVTVPNSVFNDAKVDNYGAREYRRTFTTLNVTYDTTPEQMQAFCEGIRGIIKANQFTRKDYYEVHMSAFGAHSLDVMVYFFFKVPSWTDELRERHNIYLEIIRLAQELNIEFAFPTQTLSVDYVRTPGQERPQSPEVSDRALANVVQAFAPGGDKARPKGPRIVPGALVAGTGAPGSEGEGA